MRPCERNYVFYTHTFGMVINLPHGKPADLPQIPQYLSCCVGLVLMVQQTLRLYHSGTFPGAKQVHHGTRVIFWPWHSTLEGGWLWGSNKNPGHVFR
jgi:hypothetical protein